MSRKEGKKGFAGIEDSVDTKTILKNAEEDWLQLPEQYRQHKNQQNKNKLKPKIKTIVWTFQATNKRNLITEDLDMAEKGKL